MSDPFTLGLQLAVGAVVGFTIGLTGVGGGVLVVPALTILLGMSATTAVGTASAYAFLTKIFAGFEHWRLKTVDFAMAHLFLIGAVPGNVAACLAIGHYKARATDAQALAGLQTQLKSFIAGVMVFSVILMLANLMRDWWKVSSRAEDATPPPGPMPPSRRFLGVVLGTLVGALLGATSVGGGVVIVPLLIICFGLTTRCTVGTSIYIALVLTLVTTLLSAGRGDVDWQVAALMSVGSLLGVSLGSRLANRLPDMILQCAVAFLLLVAIAGMLLT
jgi:uncharacterized membrane protein YfcA